MKDPFKQFVEEMARLTVPEDDTDESRGRRETAAAESGTPMSEIDESDLVACADDEFLCSEALAHWAMIRKARALAGLLKSQSAFAPLVTVTAADDRYPRGRLGPAEELLDLEKVAIAQWSIGPPTP